MTESYIQVPLPVLQTLGLSLLQNLASGCETSTGDSVNRRATRARGMSEENLRMLLDGADVKYRPDYLTSTQRVFELTLAERVLLDLSKEGAITLPHVSFSSSSLILS